MSPHELARENETGIIVAPDVENEAGAITYWRLAGSIDLSELRQAWHQAGLDPKELPSEPDDETALGRAVRELQRKRRLVRPLARRGAWVIKDEIVVEAQADTVYKTVCHVKYEKGAVEPVQIAPGDVPYEEYTAARDEIRAAYRRHQGELQTTDITEWLVKLAHARQATSLRDSGGVYFVPRPAMDFWRKATAVIDQVSRKAHKVFKIPALRNDEAVEAIMDSVLAEAQKSAEALEAELLESNEEDKLGKRALAGRAKKCEALLAKISGYEDLLNVRMDDIKGRIVDLQSSVATAALALDREEDN